MIYPSTPKGQEKEDLAANEYKLYDMQLFKSQLKVFQTEVQQPEQTDDKIKIQDQSLSFDEHFPISHEQGRQDHNNFSINHSLDGITEESLPVEKRQLRNKESDGKLAGDPKTTIVINHSVEKQLIQSYQDWDNRPRKCSNPMFEANKQPETQSQLVRQLEILTKQRSRYKQANYFSKKQRTVEVKSIEDLFETYKSSQSKNSQSNLHKDMIISPIHGKSTEKQCKGQNEKKDCQLCEKTRQRVQKHLMHRQSKDTSLKNPNQDDFLPQKWVIGKQPKIKKTNLSPERSSVIKYLVEEDKDSFKSEHSRYIFSGQVPLKQEYIQQNKLRQQYLKNAKQRSHEIHKELQKLKYPTKFMDSNSKNRSSSRKKIFTLNSSPSVKKPEQILIIPMTPKTVKHSNQGKTSNYRSIFSSRLEKDKQNSNKRDNQSVDFNYIKQSLVNTRIHIFNSKSKDKEKDKAQSKSNSKVKIFKKFSPKHTPNSKKNCSPRKQDIIHNFNVMDMSYECREWFQKHQREILQQSAKIFSYELIARYIGESEINVRLGQFVKGMIEPKRWILLMVDGVYARLKDRYLPS